MCYTAIVQVHPIFVLSIVDTLLSILWMCGAVVWLKGGIRNHGHLRVGCYVITLMTVVSQSPEPAVDVNSKHFPYRFFSVLLWTWLSSIPSWPTSVSNRETSVEFMWASSVKNIPNLYSGSSYHILFLKNPCLCFHFRWWCCFVFADGSAEISISPCLVSSLFLHCLLHCLV